MKWLGALLLAALVGCQKPPAPPSPRATPEIAATARSVTHSLPMGDMTVLSIPITGSGRLVEYQTCFLWRENNMPPALQCPNDRASYSVDPPEQ